MEKWFYLIKGREISQIGETLHIIEADDEGAARLEVSGWQRVDSVRKLCVADAFSRSIYNFCNDVIDLEIRHNIYKELFEDTVAQRLMEQTAHQFFLDMMKVLHDYLLLEFAKLTEQPKSGNSENFTVSNLIYANLNMWKEDVFRRLCQLNKNINTFRRYIVPLRNKHLAHIDKNTRMSHNTLGEFPEKEDEKFIHILHEIASIMHEACFGLILGGETPVVQGGVRDFKDALCRAVAFREALSEFQGNELARLIEILHSLY